jgi:hypothetical protein
MSKHLLSLVAIVLGALIASANHADAQRSPIADDPLLHGHALLIGNSHYTDRRWPTLDDVPLQLVNLRNALLRHFDTVDVRQDLGADQLRQTIGHFVRTYGNVSDARLFIYYAGHGYTETITQFSEIRGYITGIDTPSLRAETASAYDAARPLSMSMLEIRSLLNEVLARHVLFVFDSCFTGTIFTARSADDRPKTLTQDVVVRLMEKPSREFITAGRANERVPSHSPLPDLLLAALAGAADPYDHKVISALEIGIYLQDQMLRDRQFSLTPQVGRLQDPVFAEGEFLFRIVPTAPTKVFPIHRGFGPTTVGVYRPRTLHTT